LEAHAAAAAAVVATGGMPRGNRNRKWCSKLQLQNRHLKIRCLSCGTSNQLWVLMRVFIFTLEEDVASSLFLHRRWFWFHP